jgi:hypothetical protein
MEYRGKDPGFFSRRLRFIADGRAVFHGTQSRRPRCSCSNGSPRWAIVGADRRQHNHSGGGSCLKMQLNVRGVKSAGGICQTTRPDEGSRAGERSWAAWRLPAPDQSSSVVGRISAMSPRFGGRALFQATLRRWGNRRSVNRRSWRQLSDSALLHPT